MRSSSSPMSPRRPFVPDGFGGSREARGERALGSLFWGRLTGRDCSGSSASAGGSSGSMGAGVTSSVVGFMGEKALPRYPSGMR